jgi:hypothetical protein
MVIWLMLLLMAWHAEALSNVRLVLPSNSRFRRVVFSTFLTSAVPP